MALAARHKIVLADGVDRDGGSARARAVVCWQPIVFSARTFLRP